MQIDWKIKHFVDLNQYELYDVFALRINVFVVEQNCPYPELDGKDKHCFHVIGEHEGEVVATARIIPAGISYPEVSIGRVATHANFRKKGLGHLIMKNCLEFIQTEFGKGSIRISAQAHLQNYYEKHDFKATGKEYLEDGIPHLEMLFKPLV
jgi:ElaA protein